MDYKTIAGQGALEYSKDAVSQYRIGKISEKVDRSNAAAAEGTNDAMVGGGIAAFEPIGWAGGGLVAGINAIVDAEKRALKVNFPTYDANLYAQVGDGAAAVKEVRDKVNDAYWDDWATRSRRVADDAGHECGPGKFFTSKDQDTVDNLEQYTNANNHTGVTDQLVYFSVKFYNNVIDPKNAFGNEFNRVADELAKYQADLKYINSIQPGIVAKYKAIQDDLSNRINVLQKIRQDSYTNISMLNTYQNGSNINNNQSLNEEFGKYLGDRIGVSQGISIQNYEDLHSSIILQNDILQNTQDEMVNGLLKNDKKAEFVNEKKSTMYITYIRMTLAFYILLIIYFLYLNVYDKTWSIYVKLMIVSGLGIFPLIAPRIEMLLYNIWNYMMSILSGSVFEYKSLL
jgi:hypothetical protein